MDLGPTHARYVRMCASHAAWSLEPQAIKSAVLYVTLCVCSTVCVLPVCVCVFVFVLVCVNHPLASAMLWQSRVQFCMSYLGV
jgi:hypothetical protein